MNKKSLLWLSLAAALLAPVAANAQVTIGSGNMPVAGALLDLNEHTPTEENRTASKGMLFPRVHLSQRDKLYPMYDTSDANYISSEAAIEKQHAGLVVFNLTANADFVHGLYLWNGTEWNKLTETPAIEASIGNLLCQNATMTPATYSRNVPFDGIIRIPYTDGSGGSYEGTLKTALPAVNGLSIERIAGTLNYGAGDVLYRVSGTPTISSPNTTTFDIDFLEKECEVTVGAGRSLNTKNLTNDVIIDSEYEVGNESTADALPFGDITITEAGSYAFSLRLYGKINQDKTARLPFYIYLQKDNGTTLLDAAEIDLVTVRLSTTTPPTDNMGAYTDFSYSVTLGGMFEVGDKVRVAMQTSNPAITWRLKTGTGTNAEMSPVRTSLIYWKL
jgi:hypothetical protein